MANYFITWKNVILNPKLFFENMPKSGGYGEPLKFAILSYIIGCFGVFIISFLMDANFKSSIDFSILILIIALLGLFINSSIFWIFFKIMGGKGNYEGTFRQVSYSSASAVYILLPVLLIYFLVLNTIGGEYVHKISKVRSAIAVSLSAILIGGVVFIFIIAPAFVSNDDFHRPPPMVSIKLLLVTPTSIELSHNGGDILQLSDIQFTIKKAGGEVIRPSIENSSDRFSVGDIIRLSGADFGNIGDNIEIIAVYNDGYSDRPKIEILKTRTQIGK